MAELKKWLRKEGLMTKSKEVPVSSHLLLDGGRAFVPRSREHEFLHHYAKELEKGSKLYYVEARPKTYKFMIDLDITDDHYWTDEEIAKITQFIQNVIYDFYQRNQMTICATSAVKEKKDGIHTGVHLIWPKLYVISETARILRRGIVQKLNEEFGAGPKGKTWEDIVDEVIYTTNGYRMVGSDKLNPKTREPENRALIVKFVMNSAGELKEEYLARLQNNVESMVLETSIRYVLDTYRRKGSKGMEVKRYPKWLEEDALELAESNGKKIKAGEIVGNKEHLLIEQFIQSNLPPQYRRGVVKAVTRYPDGNLLVKTNSRYCLNVDRNHNSSGIYFFASPNGIYQKCLCKKDDLNGRKFGYCRDWTSTVYKISDDLRNALFPDHAKKVFIEESKGKNKYKPRSESKRVKEQEKKALCDKLLDDILS